jgi:hypothetical protein
MSDQTDAHWKDRSSKLRPAFGERGLVSHFVHVSGQVAMFHRQGQVPFDSCERRQNVIQDLLGSHAEFAAPGADFQPARFVAIIALGKILGADADEVSIIGEFHIKSLGAIAGQQYP